MKEAHNFFLKNVLISGGGGGVKGEDISTNLKMSQLPIGIEEGGGGAR